MKTILLSDCPYDWQQEQDNGEITVYIGPWHEHFSREDHIDVWKMLEEGTLELQEKLRGATVVASRLVRKTDQGEEELISETGILFSPFWKMKSYNIHKLRIAEQGDAEGTPLRGVPVL